MNSESVIPKDIGLLLSRARKAAGMTQQQVADLAGLSRPNYREIEKGTAAARSTTLFNIARALRLEIMFVPIEMVSAVQAMLRTLDGEDEDDAPAFVPQLYDDD